LAGGVSGPPAPDRSSDALFVRRVLIVVALIAAAILLWQLRTLVVMLFGAIVIATVFRAIALPLQRRLHLPERASVAAAVLLVFGLVGAIAGLFGAEIVRQVATLDETLPRALAVLQQQLAGIGLADNLRGWLTAPSPAGGNVVSSITRFLVSLSGGIADTLVVLFGGIYLAFQPRLYRTGAIKLVPASKRDLVAEAMDDSESALRLWLKAQLLSMVVVGLLTAFGLYLIGIPSWLVLGLIAFALDFIPFAGPLIAAAPAVLLALAIDPTLVIWVIGLYLLVQQLEGNILYPVVQQWAVKIPAVVLLFSLIAFGTLFGVLGVIFAAPLTVVAYVLVKRLYVREVLNTPTPIPGEARKMERQRRRKPA
jgi:predicted PurR-regulated permease PerM